MKIERTCPICGKHFNIRIADLARGYGKTCSKSCAAKLREKNKKEGKYSPIYKALKGDIDKEHNDELDNLIKIFKHKSLEVRGFEYSDNSFIKHYTSYVNIPEDIRKKILEFLIKLKENNKYDDPKYWKTLYENLKSEEEARKDIQSGPYMGFI